MAQLHKGHIWWRVFMSLVLAACSTVGHAQTQNYLLQGNKLYDEQKYKDAQHDYEKALQKDPNNTTGLFNLSNSLYQQKLYDSSRKVMASTAGNAKDPKSKAAANYNIGNTYMSQQKWEDAVNAYKQTLRNNPQDADAKYNLSYAEQMMKQQQQKQNKDKQNQQNKDQQKDKKDQQNKDKNKDQQNKDQQNKGQNDNKDNKDQQQQGQPSKLTKQQADQMLNALQEEEKKLQDKMKKEKGTPVKMDKDW